MTTPLFRCDCCLGTMNQVGKCHHYDHMRCGSCGHERFTSPHETIGSELYEGDADYNADLSISQNHKDLLQWNHAQATRLMRGFHSSTRPRLLDVGCFNGFFVKELRDMGVDAHGIDFNRKAIEFGHAKYCLGQYISARTLSELDDARERFDVVTMFEVIEHLEDFSSVIEQAVRLLEPDGLLIVSAPNSRMIWRPDLDFPPHHLSRFSPVALRCLIERMGLDVLSHAEQASSFDLLRNYAGSLLRERSALSMRGGKFRSEKAANGLRRIANRAKWLIYRVTGPLDLLLHLLGFRYIGQIIVGRKPS